MELVVERLSGEKCCSQANSRRTRLLEKKCVKINAILSTESKKSGGIGGLFNPSSSLPYHHHRHHLRHPIMASSFLAHLLPVGSRSQGASTSMMRLPSRQIARASRLTPPTCSAFGTWSPTLPRQSDQPPKTRNQDRIDEIEHVPTSALGRALLTAVSALGLLNNPARGGKLRSCVQQQSRCDCTNGEFN